MTKDAALQASWTLYNRYPGKRTAIMDKLGDYNISVDDFNAYDSTMVATANIDILDKRSEALADIPGFSQVESMSDDEILRIFEARDELNSKIDDIGRPPTESEWYKAGLSAEERIAKLRPFYETKKEEEWEHLESPLPAPFVPLMGPIGLLTELVAGGTDFRYDFGEKLHERGEFTSWNPLTGFGAWDIAEFNVNPETGQQGFSPELLAIEDELEKLYGDKRGFMEKVEEGGYAEGLPGSKTMTELDRLNTMITEEQLLDPRMFGEAQ